MKNLKTKNLLLTIFAILMLIALTACRETPEPEAEPDISVEETSDAPAEETPEPETEPAPTQEGADVQPEEETVYVEYETLEPLYELEDETEDEPEDEEIEDEPVQTEFGGGAVIEISPDIDPELVGSWTSIADGFGYLFSADGTGTRGVSPTTEAFSWQVVDGQVIMSLPSGEEVWDYSVTGAMVIFTSERLPGQLFMFNRAG